MSLSRITIGSFRNITSASLQPGDGLNLIYGQNGSGKTSILEAIYFLGMGRSFRSHLSQRVINHDDDKLTLFAHLIDADRDCKIGLRRHRSGEIEVKIDGEKVKRLSTLAETLPIQVITPESFSLLFEGPKARRQFIDWGAFHSDPHFYQAWVNTRKVLKQRNQLLRNHSPYNQIQFWDKELVRYAEQVTDIRNQYVDSLNVLLKGIIGVFLPQIDIKVSFTRGWDSKTDFAQLLENQYSRDLAAGNTGSGPHKADLRLRVGNLPAQDALSRGQLKLLVCALRIAQGKLLKQQLDKNSIYLVDDLPSELDAQHRQLLLQQLTETGAQIFVTAIEPQAIVDSLSSPPNRMFHVEQGLVTVIE
ncbi:MULTISPECIES: DNA replication/repair protein RecF [unclassified Shewanella]|jgi:DNA replication and repair protein RecF|uniref:DNA replication/repair protein RecF n=1 Tax=unclassified Shewanella TaxID=196818 RepID=UPI00137BBB0E|nr:MULTISPECIES: DNA replication/repair protein RecF [unclassified Shewanella]MBB1363179.1 DNA replication/repair protein RecF [Shewanella sp. SR44-4]MBO1898432.1 DNA replication/repair protein RecF [Shewanella sp. BF02_Schw]QHS11616.1 DNA replication/repair protein RecF [Shewanella sp. Arc9-LZ]